MTDATTISLQIQDFSGQREFVVRDVPTDASWGEAMSQIVATADLPKNNPAGAEEVWVGRLEREGRHLHASEIVGDALEEGDRIVLQPEVTAGGKA
ncbi:hypothetical protein LCGC14_1811110 [marine sediment metagenome]|uniref:Ubiquitin-like domain-containing protein n=1 Tax=marine sediment metagenome TaxID=412755 RepID=A0A0F9J1J3_9ZZZZ